MRRAGAPCGRRVLPARVCERAAGKCGDGEGGLEEGNRLLIEPIALHWVHDANPSHDLCAHAAVRISCDGRQLGEANDNAYAVSTAALLLLRTLDPRPEDLPQVDQLVPCCGHAMSVDDETGMVENMGCPSHAGVHVAWMTEDGVARYRLSVGSDVIDISFDEWRRVVVGFSAAVRAFYFAAEPKQPSDAWDSLWLGPFLAEWDVRHRDGASLAAE